MSLNTFYTAYLETALWSSTGDDDEPMDRTFTREDISLEARSQARTDCAKFYRQNREDINAGPDRCGPDFDEVGRAGHDFWLTRNGHGCGFWDGDWPEPAATRLTDAAKAFGEVNLYVGDDGLIYLS